MKRSSCASTGVAAAMLCLSAACARDTPPAMVKESAVVPVPSPNEPWPGTDDVSLVDGASVFHKNLSGLTYEAAHADTPAVLWAVRNGPGTLYRLLLSAGIWTPDSSHRWSSGKPLRYPDGAGNPDAEGVTFASDGSGGGIYVATERDNDANRLSRNSILRFDPNQPDGTLRATHEWNLTAHLPRATANVGIEAITWIADADLVARGFYDEAAVRPYDPNSYPDHGAGLFLVGLESDGVIYAFALDHVSMTPRRIATIPTANRSIMALEYDRATHVLWSACDDSCGGTVTTLVIDTTTASPTRGRFRVSRQFARPRTMPNVNNEGVALQHNAECVAGRKTAFWADDNETGGHSIRAASIPCDVPALSP